MGLEPQGGRVATTIATRSDRVAIDVCGLLEQAMVRQGYSDQESQAALFRMSRKNYQKQISTNSNNDGYNQMMKRLGQVPRDVLKEFASLLGEKVGLSVGIDSEKAQASMQLADAIANVLRVSAR